MKRIVLIILAKIFFLNIGAAQEYNASMFGCVSDGLTNNTSSIQFAIDFISQKGGGKLNFYVGRYVTGTLNMKSNVTVELHEGAILLASPNLNDYGEVNAVKSLLIGNNVSKFDLIGKGVIEFQPEATDNFVNNINNSGIIKYNDNNLPNAITLNNCNDIKINGIMFSKGGKDAVAVYGGNNLIFENLTVSSKRTNSSGIILDNVKGISMKNIYIDVKGKTFSKSPNTVISTYERCIIPSGKSFL